MLLFGAQLIVYPSAFQQQQRTVALGFQQFDALNAGAALDMDGVEDLLQQPGSGDKAQRPGLGRALQIQLEVALQGLGVAAEHGQEQLVLAFRCALLAGSLPAAFGALSDARSADAVILLQGLAQQPEQAMVTRQHELATADQRNGQGP